MVDFLIYVITRLATGVGPSLIYEYLLGILYEVKKKSLCGYHACPSACDLVAVTKGFFRFPLNVMKRSLQSVSLVKICSLTVTLYLE